MIIIYNRNRLQVFTKVLLLALPPSSFSSSSSLLTDAEHAQPDCRDDGDGDDAHVRVNATDPS